MSRTIRRGGPPPRVSRPGTGRRRRVAKASLGDRLIAKLPVGEETLRKAVTAAIGPNARIDGHRLDLVLADEVDTVVGGNAEKPRAESVLGVELVQVAKCLGEGLDGQVFGIVLITDHFKHYVINGLLINVHQLGVRLLVAVVHSSANQRKVVLGFG